MSAIPEDIMETAQEVWLEADGKILKTDAYVVIALAILAERERSRTLLSEADQREKIARRLALEEAIAAISDVPQFIKNDDEIMMAQGYAVRKTNRGDLFAAIRALQSEEH